MSGEPCRLAGHDGAPVSFTFNGRSLRGREGDTLAAALLANNVHFVARSFKYHRPRGIFSAGVEEPNAFVAIGEGGRLDTNSQATVVPLTDGLTARSINSWPSLGWDIASLTGRLGRFLPAGFYYKTFFWPRWMAFEGLIRRAAGLGVAPTIADPDIYDRPHRHCDVLIVGGGPAGIAAAVAAARDGGDVLLVEQDFALGGALLWEDQEIDGQHGRDWVRDRVADLAGLPNVTVMTRTTVAGYYDHGLLTALQHGGGRVRQRLWHIRAARVILATGAIERPMVFPGNDRPGIMLGSAVRHYLRRHRVAAGRAVVIATNNDHGYTTAAALIADGVKVAAIVDSRPQPSVSIAGVPIHAGSVIAGTKGRGRVRSVVIRSRDGKSRRRVACDLVAVSAGWSPAVQLFCQSGGKLRFDERIAAFVPDRSAQHGQCVGAAAGLLRLDDCLASGWSAGAIDGDTVPWRATSHESDAIAPIWQVPPALSGSGKQWIDFHNDVTTNDVALAARENFQSVEHLKRYTTLGMAPDQGKTSNINGLAVMGEQSMRSPQQVGTTTFRPPYTPISFGSIAGRERHGLFHPARHLPTHDLQIELGARMEDYGTWLRPAYYARQGMDMAACVAREVRAVRNAVGIMDYSPLGKIEVSGPDATQFLDQLVTTNLQTLKAGQSRYSLTLSEGGIIVDDGVISRLESGPLIMGTTSGAAGSIYGLLNLWQQRECSALKVWITNTTGHWAVILLSGPHARALLARVVTGIDLSAAAFPHMTIREGMLDGMPMRINRVGFTGEMSFEVAVPAGYAAALWRRLRDVGGDLGLVPFGLEALDVLRIEKGFFHVGGDTDGMTTPDDVGFGAMARNKQTDFRGKRSLALPALGGEGRLQLIGLRPLDDAAPLAVGAQLCAASRIVQESGVGMVTCSAWSPTLGLPIALGLLADGRSRMGEELVAWNNRVARPVRVVAPNLHDPQGRLLRD